MDWPYIYPIIILLSSLSYQLPLCSSRDTLFLGNSISINQTLVSDCGNYVLGFFPSGRSFYVGIWYNIPRRTVVWVANRENPLTDSRGVFSISNNANLVVIDSKGRILWSSNITLGVSSANSSTAARLLNSGNLVICQGEGNRLWESFNHPTDSFLPGMRLYYMSTTPLSKLLISWKDSDDPSPGIFSLGIDPSTSRQIFIWRGSKPYYRTSVWSGNKIFASRGPNNKFLWYAAIVGNYITYSLSNSSVFMRFTLQPRGQVQLLYWDESSENWTVLSAAPEQWCDAYGRCGPNGYCDNNESVCKCFRGFEPNDPSGWSYGNFSGGCARRMALTCGGDGFLTHESIKLPDRFVYLTNMSMSECRSSCLNNCSCSAFAYSNISLEAKGLSNILCCLLWYGELMDTEEDRAGTGDNLYIRLVDAELGSNSNKRKEWPILLTAAIFVTVLITCVYILWKFRLKVKGSCMKVKCKEKLSCDLTLSVSPELPLFDFDCIAAATNGFSDSCKLGQGGFGKVYKGKLPDGQDIAVKRLSTNSVQGLDEFMNEVTLIAKLQHRNLVRLLGCCIQGEEKLLIYEYMCNKSLDFFLFDGTRQALLDWGTRFDIIKGVARGLHYLHHDSRLRVIHRDLKTSNILLDQEMNPKISDFGMARIFGSNQNQANTIRVVGTYGYMAPEYAMEGLFSVKSDVYSFGVIVLEIVSGFSISSFHHPDEISNLLAYAWNLWNEGNTKDFIDPSVSESCSMNEVLRCIHVGLLCLQDHPNDRPTMSSVVHMLVNEASTFSPPKRPTFTAVRNLAKDGQPMMVSVDNVTITMVEGR